MKKETYTQRELEKMDVDELDVLAFGYKTGDIVELDPKNLSIKYQCDTENPEEKFRVGGMDWVNSVDLSEPIKVSISKPGLLEVEDGHHRLFAALKRKIKILCEIEVKGNPVKEILRAQDLKNLSPEP